VEWVSVAEALFAVRSAEQGKATRSDLDRSASFVAPRALAGASLDDAVEEASGLPAAPQLADDVWQVWSGVLPVCLRWSWHLNWNAFVASDAGAALWLVSACVHALAGILLMEHAASSDLEPGVAVGHLQAADDFAEWPRQTLVVGCEWCQQHHLVPLTLDR